MSKVIQTRPPKKWSEMTPKEKRKAKFNLFGLGLLIFFALVAVVTTCDETEEKKKQQPPQEIVFNSEWDGSVKQIEDYLKSTLNDPDSYKAVEWGKVQKTGTKEFVVLHKYRAKNGFGGVVTKEQIFSLDSLGRVTNVLDMD